MEQNLKPRRIKFIENLSEKIYTSDKIPYKKYLKIKDDAKQKIVDNVEKYIVLERNQKLLEDPTLLEKIKIHNSSTTFKILLGSAMLGSVALSTLTNDQCDYYFGALYTAFNELSQNTKFNCLIKNINTNSIAKTINKQRLKSVSKKLDSNAYLIYCFKQRENNKECSYEDYTNSNDSAAELIC